MTFSVEGDGASGLFWAFDQTTPVDPFGRDTKAIKYQDCAAVDASDLSHAKSHSCEDKLSVACLIGGGKECAGDKELYFNGYCYKVERNLYRFWEIQIPEL